MNNTINKPQILLNTEQFVIQTLKNAEGGHDWHHIKRVWDMSKYIAQYEDVDLFIVELGALLHDIADSKFHGGDEEIGPLTARNFLKTENVPKETIDHVENIIKYISFKGGNADGTFKSKELDVIQDADRIDALGAIGIARAFNYGGFKNRTIYDPDIRPKLNQSKEEYKNNKAPTINHFYEKLLLLKNKMNTYKGKEIAEERHRFTEAFLEQFYKEWNFNNSQQLSREAEEKKLKEHLIGKSIKHIEFYNYDKTYTVFNPEHQWVIDYAVKIELDGSWLSYFWDLEISCFEFSSEKEVYSDDSLIDENVQILGATDIQGINNLKNKTIKDVRFKWDYYQKINDSFELEGDKNYVPTEIILEFDEKTKLQIASVSYEIDKETKSIKNINYDLEGDLLITLYDSFYSEEDNH